MKKKYWKFFDIVYKDSKSGPREIVVNLEDFEWNAKISVGLGNLNSKAYKAIKEVSGLEVESCKAEVIYLD